MDDHEEKLLRYLGEKGERTTSEIESYFRNVGEDCPDGAVKVLMRLKGQGLINGRLDRERKGWVWSVRKQ